MDINVLILPIGIVVLFFLLIGIGIAISDHGGIRGFDYLFLASAVAAFVLSNYLWFFSGAKMAAVMVGIWVPGNLSLGMYFRSMLTRTKKIN
jgi:hypothetical protein